MKYVVEIGERTYEVEVGPDRVTLDGQRVQAELDPRGDVALKHLLLDGRSYTLRAHRADGRGAWRIEVDGRAHDVLALDERRRAIRTVAGAAAVAGGPYEVDAPMPGLIVAVEVTVGDEVREGDGLVVVEAMKMENELKATAAGHVTRVQVEEGQAVEKGETLLVIEPLNDS